MTKITMIQLSPAIAFFSFTLQHTEGFTQGICGGSLMRNLNHRNYQQNGKTSTSNNNVVTSVKWWENNRVSKLHVLFNNNDWENNKKDNDEEYDEEEEDESSKEQEEAGIKKTKNNKKSNEDDLDFPTWIKGLRQWPLIRDSSPPEEEDEALKILEETLLEQSTAAAAATINDAAVANVDTNNAANDQLVPAVPDEDQVTTDRLQQLPLISLVNLEALLMVAGKQNDDDKQQEDPNFTTTKSTSLDPPLVVPDFDQQLQFTNQSQSITSSPPSSSSSNATFSFAPLSPVLTYVEELRDWNKVVQNLQRSIGDLTGAATVQSSVAAESILKEATSRIDYLITEASTAISPLAVQDLILRAGQAIQDSKNATIATNFVAMAERLALERSGVDVAETADRARQVAKETVNLVNVANGLLLAGYARGHFNTRNHDLMQQRLKKSRAELNQDDDDLAWEQQEQARPLFDEFASAQIVPQDQYKTVITKGAEMGTLAGAIYQETIPRTHGLGHAIVANGTSANVAWMVTDNIGYDDEYTSNSKNKDPMFVRTITIRGFDASDESIDREQVLNQVCTASPEPFGENGVYLHSGLLDLARDIYQEILPYIDFMAPSHKLVINGHSIGGSISILLLLLLTQDRGVDFVRDRVKRVYSFGSPPVATIIDEVQNEEQPSTLEEETAKPRNYFARLRKTDNSPIITKQEEPPPSLPKGLYSCDVLQRFNLPSDIVHGYVQPWDPIARLFSGFDPLYPLIGDLGADGTTVYASGPPRTLRPITRAIFESWEGWPRFRDNFKDTANQNYTSVGLQHVLLPDPTRYLTDRLLSVNVQVPPIAFVMQISSRELLPALQSKFPMDAFRISFVPAAIRSFINHFYPAYGFPIVDFASKATTTSSSSSLLENENMNEDEYDLAMKDVRDILDPLFIEQGDVATTTTDSEVKVGWSPTRWLQFSATDNSSRATK